ncbi:hypothetical protein [Loktanella salsilacus]|uniref:hypothetical protein n=1 Tax=Loktanella salsilacus TaxID=195913 RepID=UPI003736FA8C
MPLPDLDLWQYRLGDTPGADSIAIGDLWLDVGADLPVWPVTDADGKAAGVLLGFAIDLQARRIIDEGWQVPARLGADIDAFAQAGLMALGGRFLWILDVPEAARIYPDCSAQVPCVFDPAAHIAASTAHAMLDDTAYQARFDPDLFNALGVDGEGWFPAGLTAHHGLHRLLPNHYLDLHSWSVQRFWSGPAAQASDPDAVVAQIVDIVQAQIEALIAGPDRVAIALTAGRETRMLLACAQPYIDRVDFVTVTGSDRHQLDTVMASRIAAKIGLNHRTLMRTAATQAQRDLFIRRGGHCNADSNAQFHPSVWPIAGSHVMVSGNGGEIARAFFWRAADTPQTAITPAMLTARFGLKSTPALQDALTVWLDGLQGVDSLTVLDLAYQEHRDGAWYAAQFCSDPGLVRQAPLLTMRSADLMMQLPPDWKRSHRLSQAVVARQWPALEQFPYNSLGYLRDRIMKLRRVMADPQIVLKKLRKLRG